ncbi:MAG TPA: arsenate reductase family protein [Verrucomicrobiota bacterium]|nr:ArsC family transcriptional regulator [Verrucomicrobiales bacterium]HRI11816.1 arsenate reductase family protein [Verrucomicrobiota bacterium]
MLKVYAYSGCDTCRKALRWLQTRGIEHTILAIRDQPPSRVELERMLAIYQGNLRRLFNTSGQDYRALGLGATLPKLSSDEALTLLAGNGNLIKRPFVLGPKVGLVGFKEDEWQARFD